MSKKIDRLKELDKIAEKLGIGQNREVKCVSCKSKIEYKDAVVLTNKKKVAYLCKKCNIKLEKGELEKEPIDDIIDKDDILDQLKKLGKQDPPGAGKYPTPYKSDKPVPPLWKEYEPDWTWRPDEHTNIRYTVSTAKMDNLIKMATMKKEDDKSIITELMRFEPTKDDNKTNASTR